MTKMIHDIINKNFNGAEKLVRENLENIAERKIIEMKKMIAAKNIMEENERRVTGISKAAVDKIGQSTDTEYSYEVDKANTPEETPNDRVKGGFDAMNNPNKVNRDTKGDQLKEKAPPGAKYERMVKHIKAEYAKNGLTDKEKSIAYATAWKAKNANMEEETLDEARFKIVRARIRNGVIQRRKKVSTAPGLTFRGGKLTRMSPTERRHRKMGQRRGKLKRRAKMSRTLRKRTMSLRKRSRLGIK